ncbi:hypothetical protein EOL73_00320 [Candidatus Saccharibacteria bacterium]|nr:hypothetical protein [Candidatus Saccharibacteria bacterium]
MKAIDYLNAIDEFKSVHEDTILSHNSLSLSELKCWEIKCLGLIKLVSMAERVKTVIETSFVGPYDYYIKIQSNRVDLKMGFKKDDNPLVVLNDELQAIRYRIYCLKELDL